MILNDLEPQNNGFYYFFRDCRLQHTFQKVHTAWRNAKDQDAFQKWIALTPLKTDQDNLRAAAYEIFSIKRRVYITVQVLTITVSSPPRCDHHLTAGEPLVVQDPPDWERLIRTFSPRTVVLHCLGPNRLTLSRPTRCKGPLQRVLIKLND